MASADTLRLGGSQGSADERDTGGDRNAWAAAFPQADGRAQRALDRDADTQDRGSQASGAAGRPAGRWLTRLWRATSPSAAAAPREGAVAGGQAGDAASAASGSTQSWVNPLWNTSGGAAQREGEPASASERQQEQEQQQEEQRQSQQQEQQQQLRARKRRARKPPEEVQVRVRFEDGPEAFVLFTQRRTVALKALTKCV